VTRLVLLPGLDGTGDLFAPFVEALAGFPTQIIAYPPDRPMSYAEHEAYARSQLPRDEEYVLLAESFSGPIGIAIAASAPPNLKALILCVTFASNPLPVFGSLSRLIGALPAARLPPQLAAPWLYAGRATPELRRAHSQAMARVAPTVIRARVAELLKVNYKALLPKIAVPILYMRATNDRLIPASVCRAIQQLRPEMGVAEFDAPHFLLQTEPHKCTYAVLSFIQRKAKESAGTMDDELPDPPLDVEQSLRVSKLTQAELQEIDRELLAQASHDFRKVARVVGMAIGRLQGRIPDVPDIYYAQRVQNLVALGKLESEGNLKFMRLSEVRLPQGQ
jgi:pimeloyl-ACP methyl ester carboxylesterase